MPTDQIIGAAGIGVVDLAEQPVLALLAGPRFHADEQPFALHPCPVEDEMEMALVDVLRALARDRLPGAAIPQHHAAATIFALGDHALEIGVAHRMVLGAHRESLVGGIGARPPGHRPAFKHAVDLEPEVVMEPRRIVLLDDEAPAVCLRAGFNLARRLGGQLEVALGVILGKGVGARHVRRAFSPPVSLRAPSLRLRRAAFSCRRPMLSAPPSGR